MKVSKVASFVGKIFMVRPSTTKTTNILPHESYPLYTVLSVEISSVAESEIEAPVAAIESLVSC